MKLRHVFSLMGAYFVIGCLLGSGEASAAAKLTLHGKILKPDNTPVNSSSVSFQIQIRSPGVENCLLYQETQTLNLSSNPGIFNLSIGSGTRPASTVDGGFTLNQIFQNRSLIDLSAAAGACTNPATSYTPAADDQRNISIQFNDGSGWQSVTAQKINPVPRALDSGKVGGYDSAQLLRVADGVPTAQTELSGAQWTELLAVISGTSTVYSKPNQLNGVNLPALSNGQTMVWNAGAWTAVTPQALPGGGTNGQVLTSDGAGGATWTAAGTTNAGSLSSGTLADARLSSNVVLKNASNTFSIGNQNITNGAPTEVNLILKGAAAQSANMLEVRNSANTLLYSVETSGTPVANTDLANKAYVDSATSTVGANYVRKDGTTALTGNWAVGNFDITGIKNIGTAGYFNQAGMAAPAVSAVGEGRIYFDSVAGKFKVSQSGGAYADLVGGSGSSQWTTSGSDIYYNTGNVGIGATPVAGTLVKQSVSSTSNVMGTDLSVTLNPASSGAVTARGINVHMDYTPSFGVDTSGLVSGIDVSAINSNGGAVANMRGGYFLSTAKPTASGTSKGIFSMGAVNNGSLASEVIGVEAVSYGFNNSITDAYGSKSRFYTPGNSSSTTTNAYGSHNRVETTSGLNFATISNAFGVYADILKVNGTITNGYGVYVGSIQSTNKFSLYASDAAAPSYFAGNVGIGTTGPTAQLNVVGANSGVASAPAVLTVLGGTSTAGGSAYGGNISMTGGVGNHGGSINLAGGTNSGLATGGVLSLSGGVWGGFGGPAVLVGGKSAVGGTAGTASLQGGVDISGGYTATAGLVSAIGTSQATGGGVSVTGGDGQDGSTGGAITLLGGTGGAWGVAGANVTINGGAGGGGFARGNVILGNLGGDVGIGTASPAGKMDLNGDMIVRGIAAPAVSAAGQGRIYFDSTSNTFKVSQNGGAYSDLVGGGGSSQWTTAASDIYYNTGNVGIGTSSPSFILDIRGNNAKATTAIQNILQIGTTDASPLALLVGLRTNASAGGRYATINVDDAGTPRNLALQSNVGSVGIGGTVFGPDKLNILGSTGGTGNISSYGDGNQIAVTNTSITNKIYMTFDTSKDGDIVNDFASGSIFLRPGNLARSSGMTLSSSGKVGIGTTTPTQALEVVGTVQATDFVSTSDRRLKRDITNIENALDKILKINGVTWKWLSNGTSDMGVIAQDVEKVFPEAVVTNANGQKSVKYGNLIGPMIEAVKTLKSENDELKLRIERLEKLMEKNSKSEGP